MVYMIKAKYIRLRLTWIKYIWWIYCDFYNGLATITTIVRESVSEAKKVGYHNLVNNVGYRTTVIWAKQ